MPCQLLISLISVKAGVDTCLVIGFISSSGLWFGEGFSMLLQFDVI